MTKTAVTPARRGGYYVVTEDGAVEPAASTCVLFLDEHQMDILEDMHPLERPLMVNMCGEALDAETLYQYAMSVEPGILQRLWAWVRNS